MIFYFALLSLALGMQNWSIAADIPIVQAGQPMATIQIGGGASVQDQFAAEELRTFIQRFTRVELDILTNREPTMTPTAIVLGTPNSNPTVLALLTDGSLHLEADLGEEGYVLKAIELGNEVIIAVAGHTSRGVIYGAYALIEACITQLTGLSPVDLDFVLQPVPDLSLPFMDETSRPFYSVRAVLEIEDADWLTRHRINMSGGEGVWTGTGIDDGLGTAFKYVDSPAFESLQDESQSRRQERIQMLRSRFDALHRRGIDSYLFMYVTGEPTKALIQQRSELLGPPVSYGGARNGVAYRPFCWSKPEFHDLTRQLIQEIVETYPTLSGFHLRAWGDETRACNCPECGDRSEKGQASLWQVILTITNAARQIRPDFKFYISGYERVWLKDPASRYARQLPQGTIFSQKWGRDGEPTEHPQLAVGQSNTLGQLGHHFIVLSHDVEEVMPFWMVEGDLFVQGVRQVANDPSIVRLGGFTVQGAQHGLGRLDRLLSTRMNWDVSLDHLRLMENYLTNQYGAEAAKPLLNALRINTWVLSSYFGDFAGSLSITGRYGTGSAWFATRFWDIIGEKAVADTLSIPDQETALNAIARFSSLLPQQEQAANEIEAAAQTARPISSQAENDLRDAVNLMRLWVAFFASRLHLVEAVEAGYHTEQERPIRAKIDGAIEFSKSMMPLIKSFHAFVPIFGYAQTTIEASLLESLEGEIAWLSNFEPQTLIREIDLPTSQKKPDLRLDVLYNHPNPFDQATTFIYELTRDADEISISIYTKAGRRVRVLKDISAQEGYNEAMWDGRDEDGEPLANGVYLYRIRGGADDEQVQAFGRLAILR
ncbi:MAG: alpha-glucuronidase family glycosyl hydrolase [Candidatus Poribacteria bacterium]|nr:alpha-glucuronidase family glycosyl hydrolase [Candidatus Poribacteria bacterium]